MCRCREPRGVPWLNVAGQCSGTRWNVIEQQNGRTVVTVRNEGYDAHGFGSANRRAMKRNATKRRTKRRAMKIFWGEIRKAVHDETL